MCQPTVRLLIRDSSLWAITMWATFTATLLLKLSFLSYRLSFRSSRWSHELRSIFLHFRMNLKDWNCFSRLTSCGSMQKTACSYTQISHGMFCKSFFDVFHPTEHSCFHFRCGLTLLLSTNLVVWMVAVTEESIHQTEIPDVNVSYRLYRGIYV